MTLEFFKNFDRNSGCKCSCLFLIRIPVKRNFFEGLYSHLFLSIGKVDQFQWRRCHQNSSKNRITKSDDSGILQEYWWETLVANTLDDWNSSRISIRILFENSDNQSDDCRIPLKL